MGLFNHKNETAPAHSSSGLPTGAGRQDPAYAQPGVGVQHQGGISGKIQQEEAALSGHHAQQQGGYAGQQPLGAQTGFQQGQAGVQQPGGFQQGTTLNDPQRQGVAHGHQQDPASHHHAKQGAGAGVAVGGAAGIMHELKAEEQKLKHDMAAHEQKKHHAQQVARQEHTQAAQRLEAAKEELKAAKANEKETKRL